MIMFSKMLLDCSILLFYWLLYLEQVTALLEYLDMVAAKDIYPQRIHVFSCFTRFKLNNMKLGALRQSLWKMHCAV